MGVKISTDEWLAELHRLSARSDEGMTAQEWSERLGLSTRVVMERLRKAHQQGWLRVGKRSTMRLDGRPTYTPVYQVVKPKR